MQLCPSRRLLTLSCLVAGALVIGMGCSADPETIGAGPTAAAPDATPVIEEEDSEDDDEKDGGAVADASKPRDAGKKRDASPPQTDASITPSPTDAGKKDSSPPPTACNAVPFAAVFPVAVSGFDPVLTGGTLVDGVYTLVSYKRYISGTSSTSFPAFSMGVEIKGSTLNLAGSGGRATYTFTASGNSLSLTRTCPSAATASWDYQISGDMLTLYGVPPSNGTWYATFERQP